MKGGRKEMLKIFKEDLMIDAKNKGGDAEEHEIKYGKSYDTHKT